LTPNYGWGLPVQASTFAPNIDFGIWVIHVAMFAIFILWSIFFVYLLIRYRRKPGVAADHGEGHPLKSLIPDFFVLAFEIALIAFYAIPGWSRIKMTTPPAQEANVVEMVAEQFAWDFQYPGADGKFGRRDAKFMDSANPLGLDPQDSAGRDDVVSINELHVPLGKPTVIYMTSKDVIHSFFIPEFRVKQDAVPGMRIPVWFEPTKAGTYELACAQLCGVDHSMMRGDVVVQTPKEYEAWLKSQTPQNADNPAAKPPENPANEF